MKLIEAENVDFSYASVSILKDVSLTVSDSEFISLTGPNGSGKTTLLKLLIGILTPLNGVIKKGNSLNVSYVPQIHSHNNSFPIRVREMVRLGFRKSVDETKYEELMKLFNIKKLENHKIRELSGGQLQKATIVRALMRDSHILALDEPTSSLDQATSELFYQYLKYKKDNGSTVLIASHDDHEISGYITKKLLVDRYVSTLPIGIETHQHA